MPSVMRTMPVCALLFVIGQAAASDDTPHAKSGGAGIRGAGFTYAKEIYPRLLKDPASTTFDWESVTSDHRFDLNDPDTQSQVSVYWVEGLLRSKNSFGAVVPTQWAMLVIERDKSSEMAVAFLGGEIVAKTDTGSRLLSVIDKMAKRREEKERQDTMARVAEAKKVQEGKKARAEGYKLGQTHGAKMGKKAKALSDAEISRRARKLASDAGYADEMLVEEFVKGYADAIFAAAN